VFSKEEFYVRTAPAVAHRVDTIMGFDRFLVVDRGSVVPIRELVRFMRKSKNTFWPEGCGVEE